MPKIKIQIADAPVKLKEMGYSDTEITAFTTAAKDVEVEIMTVEELTATKERVRTESRTASKEYEARQLATKHNLTLPDGDKKNLEKVIAAIAAKEVETAKLPIDQQVASKEAKIIELTESLSTLQTKRIPDLERQATEYQNKLNERIIDDEYKAAIPTEIEKEGKKYKPHPVLTPDEQMNRIKSKVERVKDGNVWAAKDIATGKIIKDSSEKVIPFADVVKSLYISNSSWLENAEPISAEPAKKTTHALKPGAPGAPRKYKTQDEIMAEVDKQIPNKPGKGITESRSKLFKQLQLASAE